MFKFFKTKEQEMREISTSELISHYNDLLIWYHGAENSASLPYVTVKSDNSEYIDIHKGNMTLKEKVTSLQVEVKNLENQLANLKSVLTFEFKDQSQSMEWINTVMLDDNTNKFVNLAQAHKTLQDLENFNDLVNVDVHNWFNDQAQSLIVDYISHMPFEKFSNLMKNSTKDPEFCNLLTTLYQIKILPTKPDMAESIRLLDKLKLTMTKWDDKALSK